MTNSTKPDIVYTHFLKDINRDHQITAEATLVALRPMSIKNPKAEIRLFETPSSTDQTPQLNGDPNQVLVTW